MRRFLPKSMRRAVRKVIGPAPYKVVKDLEAQQAGMYNQATGEVVPGFQIGAEDIVVDVGCGTGGATKFAALYGQAEVYALDIDPQAIATVERIMAGTQLPRPLHTILSDSNPLPLTDGLATRIICQEVLEHVEDPRQFMRELVRIGRPGAQYLLVVPDPASEALQRQLAPEAYWRPPNHLRIFSHDEFDALIRDAGLIHQSRSHFGFYWTLWWAFYWCGGRGTNFGGPLTPLLKRWNQTWAALLATPDGDRVRQALDDLMPKSQIIIARKAA